MVIGLFRRAIVIPALFAASLWPAGPARGQSALSCPIPLLEIGFDGEIVGGSKQSLVNASQRGEPIRVGWNLDFDEDAASDLSHWSDAALLSVFEGEVFAQVEAIHRQTPIRGEAEIVLTDNFSVWHGLIGSNGVLQGRFAEREAVGRRNVHMLWCSNRVPNPAWASVYRSGLNGEALEGSRDRLLSAIRAGQPIRIGWGMGRTRDGVRRSVEHVVAPDFVTITNESDVVAQLPEHIAQRSYWDADNAFFENGSVMWRGQVSTTGTFDAIWVDRGSGETVRRMPQRAVFTWYVQQELGQDVPTLAIENGVTRDEERAEDRRPQ